MRWPLVVLLFVLTAIAEIGGCYMAYLWLRKERSAWLLVPGAICLALFTPQRLASSPIFTGASLAAESTGTGTTTPTTPTG